MKKIIFIVILVSMLTLSGCTNESHASEQSAFDDFMKAYIAQDYGTAATYITTDTLSSFTSLQSLISDKEINSIVLKQMSDVDYKILSSTITEDTITLDIQIVYRNTGGAFMNAIATMYVEASEGKLSSNSSSEVSQYIRTLLFTHLDNELETMDRERTVILKKENEEWRIALN